jgi:hypothetical protein
LNSRVPTLGPIGRTFVALNRLFGAATLIGGLCLLAKCGWHLLQGARSWSQSYFAVFFGTALVIVGIVYLRGPLWRTRRESGEVSSHDH